MSQRIGYLLVGKSDPTDFVVACRRGKFFLLFSLKRGCEVLGLYDWNVQRERIEELSEYFHVFDVER